MRKSGIMIGAVVALGVLGTPALAAKSDTLPEERRGAVIGSLIGAGVGGPIGAGAGAIVGGGFIGKALGNNRIKNELSHEVTRLELEKRESEQSLRTEIDNLERALRELESERSMAEANPELPIQFRTDSSQIERHYVDDLQEVATALANSKARVVLSGFADRRGDESYNQKLSESRVAEVKRFLVQHGVDGHRIDVHAYGESRPVTEKQTPESDFFDRRVVMRFVVDPADKGDTPVAVR